MVLFKKSELKEEYSTLDKRVRKIVDVMSALMAALHNEQLTVTSVYREDIHSPHHYLRAVDIRSRYMKPEACVYMEVILNLIFPYKKGAHQTVMYHDVGYGFHFHIQVKP